MIINKIYHGDCVEILTQVIEKSSIQLIFADPPYNLSNTKLNLKNNTTGGAYQKINEEWDKYNNEEYIVFTKNWLNACYEVLTTNGGIYISCTQHNIGEILVESKKIGLKLNNIITWYKKNPMPNITKRTYTHSTEFICWFVKGKNWIFNYDFVKKFNPNKTKSGDYKQMRDFLDFIELPIVQGKERKRGEDGKALHPTQKPEKLLELIIQASSKENDVVLDPFFGTGTTGYVAKKFKRNWIGIENNPKYINIAEKRINEIELND